MTGNGADRNCVIFGSQQLSCKLYKESRLLPCNSLGTQLYFWRCVCCILLGEKIVGELLTILDVCTTSSPFFLAHYLPIRIVTLLSLHPASAIKRTSPIIIAGPRMTINRTDGEHLVSLQLVGNSRTRVKTSLIQQDNSIAIC